MIEKAVHQWVQILNDAHRVKENPSKLHKQRCRRDTVDQKNEKANKTGSCIVLFTTDWQIASVDCPSALQWIIPVLAGFGNNFINISREEKKQ